MTTPTRIFCKDCRHLQRGVVHGFVTAPNQEYYGDQCMADNLEDPITGRMGVHQVPARERNGNYDCQKFEPIPLEELTRRANVAEAYARYVEDRRDAYLASQEQEAAQPKPWWRFW